MCDRTICTDIKQKRVSHSPIFVVILVVLPRTERLEVDLIAEGCEHGAGASVGGEEPAGEVGVGRVGRLGVDTALQSVHDLQRL